VGEEKNREEVKEMKEELVPTVKYMVHATLEASGVVERPDVVGAIFGQTEGLLGDELDLRELLKTGRIGRIKVDLQTEGGKTRGSILIPSSLDRYETAIIAAALETIERIGPCEAKIKVEKIQDVRDTKRRYILERAKEIIKQLEQELPEAQEITEHVKDTVRVEEIVSYKGLPAGPEVENSDAIIIVEGRADVLNLLRAGIKNVVAVNGTSIPPEIVELTKNKTVTAFVDSDRGGDLILKELLQVAKVDYVARPPPGRSVEDLTRKEIIKALKDKKPVSAVAQKLVPGRKEIMQKIGDVLERLKGSFKGVLLNYGLEPVKEVPVAGLRDEIRNTSGVLAVVFDGVITQELAELAAQRGVKYLAGVTSAAANPPAEVRVVTLEDLRRTPRDRVPW
jgi:DNA primase